MRPIVAPGGGVGQRGEVGVAVQNCVRAAPVVDGRALGAPPVSVPVGQSGREKFASNCNCLKHD